ncbi:hypothetical protein BH23CHL4_BH23CHL4_17800 [soil metagenome]
MKRLGIFLLLAALILGQSAWLAPSAGAFAQEIETAAESSPETGAPEDPTATPTSTDVPVEFPTETPVNTATTAPSNTPESADEDPVIVAAEPTSTPTYKNIKPGDTVRVDVSVLNVRSGTSTSTQVIAQVRLGQTFVVLEGPELANGFDWIKIDRPGTTSDGWIAAQYVALAVSAATATSTNVPTETNTPSPSPTLTGSETATATATNTVTATNTPVASATATATATYKNIKPGDTIEVDVPMLNVRTGTSASGTVITQVRDGQTFNVLEGPVRANGYDWIKIDLTGFADGWVAAQYVALTVSAPPTATTTPSNTPTPSPTLTGSETATATATATIPTSAGNYVPGNVIVITTGVNVRSGAGTGNGILKVARAGEQGTVNTGNTSGGAYTWAEVEFSDVTGWVAINYITHVGRATATPAPGVWLLSLTLDCFSSPERITLANSANSSITVNSIVTHYDAGAGEPWQLNHTLGANQTRSYLTGAGAAGAYALTTSYRLTDSAGSAEGVTVETSLGTIQRSCPAVSTGEKWVEVNLSSQYMTVWQGSTRITGTYVSTGRPGFDTPTGTFRTWLRYVSQNMSGCIQGECYYVPNVPYVHYFTYGGHALHGAYWHNNFGNVMSHGCVNLPVPFSEWLYYWFPNGSRVVVHY